MSELSDRLEAQERKFAHEGFRRLAEADAKLNTERLLDSAARERAVRIGLRVAIMFALVGIASVLGWFLETHLH